MFNDKKIILHLCADTGSDSKIWKDNGYDVRLIGSSIGVENYIPPKNVYGIIANPPCTEFSTARKDGKARSPDDGMFLVEHCLRIINKAKPKFWVLENPARGVLKKYLGEPVFKYQPWEYGSPWTKHTALWGEFNIPEKTYTNWDDVPKIPELYTRPNRQKPSLAFMHKSSYGLISEFQFLEKPKSDMEFRSLCSQKFAKTFYEVNKPKKIT